MIRSLGAALLTIAITNLTLGGEVRDMREMSTDDFTHLELAKTAVLIPGGILEQHGPYLPAFSDGYHAEHIVRKLAAEIAARPGWTALIFPTIPLGEGGANQVGKRQVMPGTFHVHYPTLRAVYMDLASELGEAGFRWIFVQDYHGAPRHRLAILQSGEFFGDTYGGVMINLADLQAITPIRADLGLTDEERTENAFDIHAGMQETSLVLALRPDLVRPEYKTARPFAGRNWLELVAHGAQAEWPGYYGSPRLATVARGEATLQAYTRERIELALQILDGLDPRSIPRNPYIREITKPELSEPGLMAWVTAADEHARAIAEKQQTWLEKQGLK